MHISEIPISKYQTTARLSRLTCQGRIASSRKIRSNVTGKHGGIREETKWGYFAGTRRRGWN
jgi:hypothetical protein